MTPTFDVSRYTLTSPQGVVFREGDTVRLTGQATSPIKRFVDLVGMVGTASPATPGDPEDFDAFKIWPRDKTGTDGKIWFPVANVEALELLTKGDLWENE